jgi:hypothetical protein
MPEPKSDEERARRVANKLTGATHEERWSDPIDTRELVRMLITRGILPDGQIDPSSVRSRLCYGFRRYEDGTIEVICDD